MMKQITTKVKLENGAVTRKCVNMLSLLNLNVMNLLNKTKLVGYLGIPQMYIRIILLHIEKRAYILNLKWQAFVFTLMM